MGIRYTVPGILGKVYCPRNSRYTVPGILGILSPEFPEFRLGK